MCNIDPDEVTEMTRITDALRINCDNSTCRKCGSSEVEVVLRLKEPYCRTCYLTYFTHKFRSTIGKSKQIKAGDEVLVAVSGGMSSAAIIHLIQRGTSDESVKKLRFHPTFLYIDECSLGNNEEDRLNNLRTVCSSVGAYDFKCYVTCLENVMQANVSTPELYDQNFNRPDDNGVEKNKHQLQELLDGCSTNSTKQDLIYRLRQQLICKAAKLLKFQKVFLADNATTIAIRILSNIAQGRGSQLSSDVHFKSIHGEVEIFRPLREALEEEISHYTKLNDIEYLSLSPSSVHEESSILACSKKFILDLQKDFPATIPTVFRTGDKLVAGCLDNEESTSEDINDDCILCGNIKDIYQGESSALFATIISERFSNSASPHLSVTKNDDNIEEPNCSNTNNKDVSSDEARCNGSCDCDSKNNKMKELSKSNICLSLCYSCRIIVKEMNMVELLPPTVKEASLVKLRRSQMKQEIQDFLL